ncbi:MAG: hypothetical protein ACXACG_10115 [Candidatus Thorarchaeota archaeon]
MKKQPTPSPDKAILPTVSKSGSTTLEAIIIPPATISNLSGMDLLETTKMMGENMNKSAKVFWFNDSGEDEF